jgi:hypothetical protein
LLCRLRSRRTVANHDWPDFASDAHRMRGVIRLCFALSPVESYRLFPWQVSSRLLCTLMFCRMQEEFSTGNFRALNLRKKKLNKMGRG